MRIFRNFTNSTRGILYDNWFANLFYFLKQVYKNKSALEEMGIRFSLIRMCLYCVLPLKKYQPEVLERKESRQSIIGTETIKMAKSIRQFGLNEMLYPEVHQIDLYNVIVKLKPQFSIFKGIFKTILLGGVLYFLWEHTIIVEFLIDEIIKIYDVVSK